MSEFEESVYEFHKAVAEFLEVAKDYTTWLDK